MKDTTQFTVETLAVPVQATATVTSDAFDRQVAVGTAAIAFAFGAPGDTLSTSVKWTAKVQESNDNSTWTDVQDGDLVDGTNAIVIDANAKASKTYALVYKGTRRYVRGVITATGTHTQGTPLAILALAVPKAVPDVLPVAP